MGIGEESLSTGTVLIWSLKDRAIRLIAQPRDQIDWLTGSGMLD